MKQLRFSTKIKAPKEKVWNALWEEKNYNNWTSVFSEGSYAVTDNWKEGTKVQFLSPGGTGMYSTVAKNIPNEQMTFRHIGEMKEGKELPPDEKTKLWTGALESYFLKETNGETDLSVEIDMAEEHEKFFADVFPKALQKVKEMAEK